MRDDDKAFSLLGGVAAAQGRGGQPQATFLALAAALQTLVGHKVMTVQKLDLATLRSVRLFSSEKSYPAGGEKQHRRGAWSEAVIDRGIYFLAPTSEEVRSAFFDHAGIAAAGCGSIMCFPIRYDGRTLATLNLWHESDRYDAGTAERALPFASLLVPACLTE